MVSFRFNRDCDPIDYPVPFIRPIKSLRLQLATRADGIDNAESAKTYNVCMERMRTHGTSTSRSILSSNHHDRNLEQNADAARRNAHNECYWVLVFGLENGT